MSIPIFPDSPGKMITKTVCVCRRMADAPISLLSIFFDWNVAKYTDKGTAFNCYSRTSL